MSKSYTLDCTHEFQNTKVFRNKSELKGLVIGMSRFSLIIAFCDDTKVKRDRKHLNSLRVGKNV